MASAKGCTISVSCELLWTCLFCNNLFNVRFFTEPSLRLSSSLEKYTPYVFYVTRPVKSRSDIPGVNNKVCLQVYSKYIILSFVS